MFQKNFESRVLFQYPVRSGCLSGVRGVGFCALNASGTSKTASTEIATKYVFTSRLLQFDFPRPLRVVFARRPDRFAPFYFGRLNMSLRIDCAADERVSPRCGVGPIERPQQPRVRITALFDRRRRPG